MQACIRVMQLNWNSAEMYTIDCRVPTRIMVVTSWLESSFY